MCITIACSKCKIEKELTAEFYARNCTTVSGFSGMCKLCKREYKNNPTTIKNYYEKNKEIIVQRSKAHYEKLKELNPNRGSEIYHKTKHKTAAKSKAYRDANKDKISAYNKTYKQENKEKIKQLNFKSAQKQRDLLTDSYIKATIVTNAYNNNIKLVKTDITPELIQIQRENIQLCRENNINNFLNL